MTRLRLGLPPLLRKLRRDKTAQSSARREGRHRAEADDTSIPLRTNKGLPAKTDDIEDIEMITG